MTQHPACSPLSVAWALQQMMCWPTSWPGSGPRCWRSLAHTRPGVSSTAPSLLSPWIAYLPGEEQALSAASIIRRRSLTPRGGASLELAACACDPYKHNL